MRRDSPESKLRRVLGEERMGTDERMEAAVARIVWAAREERRDRGSRERMGFGGLMLCQIRFMGWRIWLWELTLTAAGAPVVRYVLRDPYFTARRAAFFVSSLVIMISMAALPFLYRSVRHGMIEIETASYFSMKRLLLARALLLFAGEAAMAAGLLGGVTMHSVLDWGSALGCVALTLGIVWSGLVGVIGRASPEKVCEYYLKFGFGIFLLMAGVFQWMPWVFDRAANFAAPGAVLIMYCGYEGVGIVKKGTVRA